jgi:hypothetical protein
VGPHNARQGHYAAVPSHHIDTDLIAAGFACLSFSGNFRSYASVFFLYMCAGALSVVHIGLKLWRTLRTRSVANSMLAYSVYRAHQEIS